MIGNTKNRVRRWSRAVARMERGYFVEPTIFANGRPDMRIASEEIFGPVLTVMRFDDLVDVGRLGNATSYGLGAGVYTTNVSNAHKAARLNDSHALH